MQTDKNRSRPEKCWTNDLHFGLFVDLPKMLHLPHKSMTQGPDPGQLCRHTGGIVKNFKEISHFKKDKCKARFDMCIKFSAHVALPAYFRL